MGYFDDDDDVVDCPSSSRPTPEEDMDLQRLVQNSVRDAVEAARTLSQQTSRAARTPSASTATGLAERSNEPRSPSSPADDAYAGPDAAMESTSCSRLHARAEVSGHAADCEAEKALEHSEEDGPTSAADVLDVPDQPQASLRLHKAQIKALARDLQAAQAALQVQATQNKELTEELRGLRAERASASKMHKALDNQVSKLQTQVEDLRTQLSARDTALRQVSDESNLKERAKRATEGDLKAHSARLNRALEEVQRYRKLLEENKEKQRTEKSVALSDHNRVVGEVRKLERQKAELLAAFRKQMKLIDVLRRQKVHIEAARMLQFSEEEFMRALEMPATTF